MKQKRYYDKFYSNYTIKDKINIKDYFINRFLDLVIKDNTKKVLEIGCGDGFLTEYLLKRKLNITGVDISKIAINKLKHKFKNEILNKKFKPMKADIIKFLKNEKKKYDLIIGSGILHHIEKNKWRKLFKLVYMRLKKGGIFACAPEPNANGIYSLIWKTASFFYKLYKIEYNSEIEKGTFYMKTKFIKNLLYQNKFKKIKILPYQIIPHFTCKLLREIDKILLKFLCGEVALYIIIIAKK